MDAPLNFNTPQDPAQYRQAKLIQFMARIGTAQCVALITVASVLGSVAVTVFYYGLFTPGLHVLSFASWAITIGTPLLIAPLVSFYMVQLMIDLDQARRMAYTLAITDGLTGLYNRRYFMAQVDTELSKARRHRLDLSLVMVDADHFKAVNDTYGHDVGDVVLKSLANAAKSCLREHDVLARYGGEEFVMLLPHTDLNGAVVVAERVRSTVERQDVVFDGGQILHITVSLGVASLSEPVASRMELLKNADLALYQAKELGRNRVQTTPLPP